MEKYVSNERPFALVVDDDALLRMNAIDILTGEGFRVIDSENADEALAILSQRHPAIQLLFTDVQMPGAHDGLALARETAARWPQVQIFITSGTHPPKPEDVPDKAVFIAKPIAPEIVHKRLTQLFPILYTA